MTRRTVLCAALLAIGTQACGQGTPKPAPRPAKPWTLLVYGAADNTADAPILEFMDGVRKALDDDPGMEVLFFIDRSEKRARDTKMLGKAFGGARLYRVRKASVERLAGGEHFPQIKADAEVELDSADATNLGRFIAWGKATAPAERYALMIYSHANGRTMCPDEESGRDMGIAEVTDEIGPEGRVDFLALELCNMGGAEIAYQWRPEGGRFSADVLLAIPNAGPPLDWHRAFARIRTEGHLSTASQPPLDPTEMTAAEFGELVIEEGKAGRLAAAKRGGGSHEAGAAYDLRKAAAVKEAVDALARELAAGGEPARTAFMSLRGSGKDGVMRYEPAYPDLYDLCKRASQAETLSAGVRKAAATAMERVDAMVTSSFGMSAYPGFEDGKHGVFIVLPPPDAAPKKFAWYTPSAGSGNDYGKWAFLRDGTDATNSTIDSWYMWVSGAAVGQRK